MSVGQERYVVTEKGLRYLDRMMGSQQWLENNEDRKESILGWLERRPSMTFDELYDLGVRQREQKARGEMGYAPSGSRYDYYETLRKLLRDGYVEVE